MRKIKTIDDITKDGKVEFGEGYEFVSTAEEADAILMRSTDLHGYELPEGIRAIARCGAGVNNIPVEEYAKKGVVVFNSPGANSNAVKELVLGMLVLSSRGVVQSMNWVLCGPRAQGQAHRCHRPGQRGLQGRQRLRRSGHGRLRLRPVHFRRARVGAEPRGAARGHARGSLPRLRLPHRARAQQGRHHRHDQHRTD